MQSINIHVFIDLVGQDGYHLIIFRVHLQTVKWNIPCSSVPQNILFPFHSQYVLNIGFLCIIRYIAVKDGKLAYYHNYEVGI